MCHVRRFTMLALLSMCALNAADDPTTTTTTTTTTAPATPATPAPPAAEPPYRRGVNLAGPEFGDVPGKLHFTYTYNNENSFKYFGERGFTVIRVPIRWERIQTKLNGPLDPENLKELKQNIVWAKKYNSTVVIDVHNYCRYSQEINGKRVGALIDAEVDGKVLVSSADFADLWTKLSTEFKDEPGVYGYGLMNEPNNMGNSDWKAISNAAVKAIRDNKDTKLILVGGNHWSNAANWEGINGPTSWVNDSANHFLYEAHCYFDHDNSGSYKKSYADELAANPKLEMLGAERLAGFIAWCKKNNVKGFLGEFAAPRDDPRWNVVLEHFMDALDEAEFGGTYWAAGTFWGDYPMTLQPADNFKTDRPQMQVMLKHLGKK